jgi:hypothetical protein
MTSPPPIATPLYDATLRIDEVIDFGYPLAALASGAPIPPSGIRFDVNFSGTVRGPRLTGAVGGVDYLSVRADGRLELHLHARVRTEDGASPAFVGTGLAIARRDAGPLSLFDSRIRKCWQAPSSVRRQPPREAAPPAAETRSR